MAFPVTCAVCWRHRNTLLLLLFFLILLVFLAAPRKTCLRSVRRKAKTRYPIVSSFFGRDFFPFFLVGSKTIVGPPTPQSVQRFTNNGMIRCLTDDPAGDVIGIKSFVENAAGDIIFDSNSGQVSDAEKYMVQDTYSLTILSATWGDGGPYGCEQLTAGGDQYQVEVVVMGE